MTLYNTGWVGFQTAVNIDRGKVNWSSPTNALVEDGAQAYSGLIPNNNSGDWLRLTNFNFNVPQRAVLRGIEMRMKHRADTTDIEDGSIRLIKNGVASGTDKAGSYGWPFVLAWSSTYGSSSDMWNTTYTPDDINDVNWGIQIYLNNTFPVANSHWGRIDALQLRIYYVQRHYASLANVRVY